MLQTIAFAVSIAAGAPQAPIAAGPFASLRPVLDAAQRCGIDDLKIRTYGVPRLDGFELFLLDTSDEQSRCLVKWQTHNGKRLHLKPR